MPGWVRAGINVSAELAEVPAPTLEPWTLLLIIFILIS